MKRGRVLTRWNQVPWGAQNGKEEEEKLTRPLCIRRFLISRSSPFATGTGDASAKRTDVNSAKRNKEICSIMMVLRLTRNAGDLQGEYIGIKIWRQLYTWGKCSFKFGRAPCPEMSQETLVMKRVVTS